MSDGNTNIVHVEAIQGLLSEVAKHLGELEVDESTASKFSEQTIAKENATEGLKVFQDCDIHGLQKAFE